MFINVENEVTLNDDSIGSVERSRDNPGITALHTDYTSRRRKPQQNAWVLFLTGCRKWDS